MERSGRGSELGQEQPGQRSLRQEQLHSHQWTLKQKWVEGWAGGRWGPGLPSKVNPQRNALDFMLHVEVERREQLMGEQY